MSISIYIYMYSFRKSILRAELKGLVPLFPMEELVPCSYISSVLRWPHG